MPKTLAPCSTPRYQALFPDWHGPRPLEYFLIENLLEARRQSGFPTNAAGPDEDVNIYLAQLLTRALTGRLDERVVPGVDPLLLPPNLDHGARSRAHWYRANGDHRLLHLGIFNRGDGLRRRRTPWGLSHGQARRRDFGVGSNCYLLAGNLLEKCGETTAGLTCVVQKLAEHFADYVHVLTVLATRRLGLGAILQDKDLSLLMAPTGHSGPVPTLDQTSPSQRADTDRMDELLDLILEYRNRPVVENRRRLAAAAKQLGVDFAGLTALAG
jgi:hypothetical protein